MSARAYAVRLRRRARFAAFPVVAAAVVLTTGPGTAVAAADACSGHLYSVNSYADNVSVIDTNTNTVTATIPVGKSPAWATFTPDRKELYVSNNGGASISVIDVATNTVVRTIPTDSSPVGVAFTPDGTRLILSFIPGTIRIITLSTGVSTPPISVGLDPEQIRVTPDGKDLWVASSVQGVYKVDIDTATVTAHIPLDGILPFSYNLLITPDGKTVYVAATLGGFIAQIDTASDSVTRTWKASGPVGLQLSADRTKLYVTNFWGASLDEYSLATGELLQTSGSTAIGFPSHAAESADGRYVYFGQSFDTKLEVFDVSAWKPVTTLTVGTGPNSLAVCDSASPR